jgi:hypothetical protein
MLGAVKAALEARGAAAKPDEVVETAPPPAKSRKPAKKK